jgi:hypothetical protein
MRFSFLQRLHIVDHVHSASLRTKNHQIRNITMATKATPPTTPPAIAPTLLPHPSDELPELLLEMEA